MQRRKISIQTNPEACAQAALTLCIDWIEQAIQNQGKCIVVLAGGSTPKILYEKLGKLNNGAIDWNKVILLWGDERNVGAEHPDSNFRMAKQALLDHLPVDQQPQVYRIRTGDLSADQAALEYDRLLNEILEDRNAALDIVLLGIGDDAHTASLFPDTKAISETTRFAIENWVEKLNTWRVTLTYRALNRARHVCFLVCGSSKTPALKNIWIGEKNIQQYPAQGVEPSSGDVLWLVDEAAANGLEYLAE